MAPAQPRGPGLFVALACEDAFAHHLPTLADANNLSDLPGSIVAQTKLLEFALLVQLVACLEGHLITRGAVRCVEIEDVGGSDAQLLQAHVPGCSQFLRSVISRALGHALRGNFKTTLLETGLAGEAFLLAGDVEGSGVELVVALGGEEVEALLVLVERGDAGAGGGIGTNCHGPEDETVLSSHGECDE
ncbi:unnamed protein product [Clonostachys byssicola]|uniref:Uncharacterized protein n=1 Tax=Clonostachys byssicola TaxID=160290 RepID=A0A9N9U518_9HYPO|nr:unnamed protein product [Clonostachys byssicola]